jgi:tRNA threonylcarbamoyladenosine biosynthesis protein TsaE
MTPIELHWLSGSEEATARFGACLARALVPPAWVGLEGPLGAGKTRLVQGIARGLGYAGRVRSPSFVLENRYRAAVPIRHQDLYRLDEPDEDLVAGWEEDRDSIVLVEWADRVPDRPARSIGISLRPAGPSRRWLRLSWKPGGGVIRDLSLHALGRSGEACPEGT